MNYVVTMYRWGCRENHSYVVGVYHNEQDAINAGELEACGRGGKYEYEVLGFDENNNKTYSHSEVDINKLTLDEWKRDIQNVQLVEK